MGTSQVPSKQIPIDMTEGLGVVYARRAIRQETAIVIPKVPNCVSGV